MKKLLLAGAIAGFIILNACNDSEDPANPLVKTWKLDEISATTSPDGFESNGIPEQSVSFSYTVELREDLTYTRTVGEDPDAQTEVGDWEEDDMFLELDPEAGTANREDIFIFYDAEITSVDDRQMDVTFQDNFSTYPDAKITEWVGNGVLVENTESGFLEFTVTPAELDSIRANFFTEVTLTYSLNFDSVD